MPNQAIRKAVIPVAGLGTRMLPATKAIPKEMLPVVDKPLIQYVVQEAISAGIKEIVLVTHASKNSIENHFDTSFELEAQLERRVKRQLLEAVQAICPKDVTIISVRQSHAKGLGHAILCAKSVVGDNPFAVMLPDVLIDEHQSDLRKDNLAEMVAKFDQTQASQIMVEGVPQDKVHLYGIADIGDASINAGEFAKINRMVEKPALEEAPSNLAVVGRYVLSNAIWSLLERTPVGAGDEIQLTDAIDMLIEQQEVDAYYMKGGSHDCGSKFGYVRANIEYALRHSETGERTQDLINQLAK
ncbi:UTP--glucose-1-phosphate uridylyltransferase GalU [Paraferrimonas haliotis]|uniref:UTP--glucose-1-phosphate uridylyltransferase n=1 Tax=Paraferrimonas haliotis TaxID=2013866 RepID=A0AA37TT72_9GAMM|nr:UTP--glucose-1-phosphate uridylyltransferase GalU [Paraferrimonas haliotis]GLS83844.1 UTP--glucose-1-phosphate uridylyltransferase [Paraferrimonas haliotis]GLS83971.1 UTP--glucose-1-phosphate uridylyltransferase [Paraferrimonas haliotis]